MVSCRDCRREIRWYRTESGKAIPLDVDPELGGNVEIDVVNDKQIARVVAPDKARIRYTCHFATCTESRKVERAMVAARKAEKERKARSQLDLFKAR